jgi:hypothetical protein
MGILLPYPIYGRIPRKTFWAKETRIRRLGGADVLKHRFTAFESENQQFTFSWAARMLIQALGQYLQEDTS